jgi:2-phospho-L-lactate/phosphoenolpyruvate guanylyltransferase
VSGAAVLIPVKAFASAKQRLSTQLSAAQRIEMAHMLGSIVIAAAAPLPVFVVCDDDEVAQWATANGAGVSRQDGTGLNGALFGALVDVARFGFDHAVIVHADLPHAHDLIDFVVADTIVLVPDRHGDGTNVLSMPLPAPLTPRYGASSFRHHHDAAIASGWNTKVIRSPDLGWDIDTPADLPTLHGWTFPAKAPSPISDPSGPLISPHPPLP